MANIIDRRSFLGAGAAAVIGSPAILTSQTKAKPNLLFILTDQQHFDSISAGGCRYVRTPAMDHLWRRGMTFSESYCPDPVCSPSRSAIFSGRMASETGVIKNRVSIRKDIPNLGQWFKENSDYETLYSGKWHLPATYPKSIPGFRVLPGGIGSQGNLGDTCVSRSCEAYLRNHKTGKPFMMVASFMQPHDICEWLRLNLMNSEELRFPELKDQLPPLPANFEYDPEEPNVLRKNRKNSEPSEGKWGKLHWRYYLWNYYRYVEMVDGEVGRILQALHDSGRDKDTLIIFSADHGEGMAHHQNVRKSISYDEAAKVPLLISWPGQIPQNGTVCRQPVSGIDLMPTLSDFAGIRPNNAWRGRSLRPLLQAKPSDAENFIVVEIPPNVGRVVRTPRYKYVTYVKDPIEQLYDMIADPGETKNLARTATHAPVVAEHKKLLRQWEARLDPVPDSNLTWWRGFGSA